MIARTGSTMVSSEVQRTLVKSPPELWAELSDAASLARHLGDLGDLANIHLTRVHDEERVDWEADRISGSVLMKASGWGTKVTLRVSREVSVEDLDAGEPSEPAGTSDEIDAVADSEAAPAHESELTVEDDATQADSEATPAARDDPASATEAVAEANSAPTPPRLGFFARLFRKRPRATPEPIASEPVDELAAPPTSPDLAPTSAHEPEFISDLPAMPDLAPMPESTPEAKVDEPTPEARVEEPTPEPGALETALDAVAEAHEAETPEPSIDLAAELKAAEEAAEAETTAVLTATLDRLGAAHHRPFSRA